MREGRRGKKEGGRREPGGKEVEVEGSA